MKSIIALILVLAPFTAKSDCAIATQVAKAAAQMTGSTLGAAMRASGLSSAQIQTVLNLAKKNMTEYQNQPNSGKDQLVDALKASGCK